MPRTPLRSLNPEFLPLTLTDLLGFPPRDGQIKAIHSLAVDQVDLLLIDPTGWGKSAVFQAVPALRGGICLMIMPLNLKRIKLVDDQAHQKTRTRLTSFLEFDRPSPSLESLAASLAC